MPPIAGSWPGDLQFAVRRLVLRLLPLVDAMPRPLGWAGALDDVLAMAQDLPPPPAPGRYSQLVRRLGLSPVEELLAVAAMSTDLDARLASLWQIIGNRIDATRPSIGALLQLAEPDERGDVLAVGDPAHPLRALGLVTLMAAGAPLDTVVASDPSLPGLIAGFDASAAALGVTSQAPGGDDDPPAAAVAIARRRSERGAGPVAIFVDGPAGSGRGWLARSIAGRAERGTVWARLDAERARAAIGAIARTALFDDLVPCVEVPESFDPVPALSGIAHLVGGPWIIPCDGKPNLPPPWQTFAITTRRPDAARREKLWRTALGGDHPPATELARRFPLSTGAVFRAADDGLFRAAGASPELELARAAREQLELRSSLAERVRTPRRLTDLVAPPHTRALLEEIIGFARQRRKVFEDWGFSQRMRSGLKVLFAGPPGTGKTMSAEIIAAELDLDLFRIDLSNVVSKWVGETEKNLKRAFDEADATGGVLLFDEADSLFGKRTSDVRSATDRYANLEVNYLLQRMETHDGIVLLTTNLETGIDEAFVRRLNFRVRFQVPDVEERAQLWEQMIPAETPRGERLDFPAVAERFDMAGGNIKNAALRAAVLAANEGTSLITRHLMDAGEREFTEIGRIAK